MEHATTSSKCRKEGENYQLNTLASATALALAANEAEVGSPTNNLQNGDPAALTISTRVSSHVRTGVQAAGGVARAIDSMSSKSPKQRSRLSQHKKLYLVHFRV